MLSPTSLMTPGNIAVDHTLCMLTGLELIEWITESPLIVRRLVAVQPHPVWAPPYNTWLLITQRQAVHSCLVSSSLVLEFIFYFISFFSLSLTLVPCADGLACSPESVLTGVEGQTYIQMTSRIVQHTRCSPAQIPSVKPALLDSLGSALRVAVVALHHARALGQQQPLLPIRQVLESFWVHNSEAGPRNWPSCRGIPQS